MTELAGKYEFTCLDYEVFSVTLWIKNKQSCKQYFIILIFYFNL